MACNLEMQRRLGNGATLNQALNLEYRINCCAQADSDLLVDNQAAIIDKDRKPSWRNEDIGSVPAAAIRTLLSSLEPDALSFEE